MAINSAYIALSLVYIYKNRGAVMSSEERAAEAMIVVITTAKYQNI